MAVLIMGPGQCISRRVLPRHVFATDVLYVGVSVTWLQQLIFLVTHGV